MPIHSILIGSWERHPASKIVAESHSHGFELKQRLHSPLLVGAKRRSRPSGATGNASESKKLTEFLTVEDSLQLAAGFFK